MNFANKGRTLALSAIASYNRARAQFKSWKNINSVKLVQFFSVRKDFRRRIREQYVLSSEEKTAIDDFYKKYYGRTVTHKWHSYFAGINQTFVKEYIPMSLHFSEIEYFMNPHKEYIKVFQDKSIISLLAISLGIISPMCLFKFTNGVFYDENFNLVDLNHVKDYLFDYGEIFIKPSIDSCGGRGCGIYDIHQGVDKLSGENLDTILKKAGKQFLIQNVIKNHESIRRIYDKSLNTFRIITYQWDDNIYNAPVAMRLGRNGSRVDNASAGGVYIAVDVNGQLHEKAYADDGSSITQHPDSGIVFKTYQIKSVQETIDAAKRMHRALSKLGIINWDFAIDEAGDPVLIEANTIGGGMDMVQVAHGVTLFEERTPQILQWVALMESLSPKKRVPYYFGRNMKKQTK